MYMFQFISQYISRQLNERNDIVHDCVQRTFDREAESTRLYIIQQYEQLRRCLRTHSDVIDSQYPVNVLHGSLIEVSYF